MDYLLPSALPEMTITIASLVAFLSLPNMTRSLIRLAMRCAPCAVCVLCCEKSRSGSVGKENQWWSSAAQRTLGTLRLLPWFYLFVGAGLLSPDRLGETGQTARVLVFPFSPPPRIQTIQSSGRSGRRSSKIIQSGVWGGGD